MFSTFGPKVHSRFYGLIITLAVAIMILPSIVRGEEKIDAEARRTTEYLLRNTYLGHAAELPSLDEPVEVLQRYLGQGLHGTERRSPSREVTIWRKLVQKYPNSRYASFGLARAYNARFENSQNPQDLQRAINALSRASEIALSQGRIRYTRDISVAIVQANTVGKGTGRLNAAQSVEQLDQVFGPLIAAGPSLAAKEFYLALVDYADGLAALGDERAWEHFERAIDLRPENNTEAINRHAKRLLEQDRAREALDLLESRMSRDERIRRVLPAHLRKEAMVRLGLDVSSASEEIEEIDSRMSQGMGAITTETAKLMDSIFEPVEYSHTNHTDDCRSTTYAQRTLCSQGRCYYPWLVNLAEILWNEARGESWGQSDMVGWTVRNRVLQSLSCDIYRGGLNWSTCPSLPCGDPNNCDISRRYCCAEHGGTTTVGTPHQQFNDGHVLVADLEVGAVLIEAYDIINGRIPDPSTGFVPSGISGCNGTSCSSFCTTGANIYSPSPRGPMEYLGYDYCAKFMAGTSQCKWYAKNTCGDLPTPTSCSPTPRNYGDNHFWNRNF